MNIAIVGATGKFGRAFTARLLTNPDYQLTLISKNAEDIFEDNHRLTAKSINAANLNQLTKSLGNADMVLCAVSGTDLPAISQNLVELNPERLIMLNAVGIYNELPEGLGDEFNLDCQPLQIPNRQAADIIENSTLDYTILRLGFFEYGDENEYVITQKGDDAKGYSTIIESVEKISLEIIENPKLYLNENIAVTKDMG